MKATLSPTGQKVRGHRPRFERSKMALSFSETIPSTLTAANRMVAKVLRVAERMKCGEEEMNKVELALREALTNAILHGNLRSPRKRVSVRCYCQEDCGMLLTVEDEGSGFDTDKILDPTEGENIYSSHGRGIYLMRKLMDEVRFERSGARVVLKKRGRR